MRAFGHAVIFCMMALLFMPISFLGMSNLTKNDPYPVFTSADPHNFLLVTRRQELSLVEDYDRADIMQISISGYRQTANSGTNTQGVHPVNLGDLTGRWNVLGLFFPEADGNTDIGTLLIDALGITQEEIDHCFTPTGIDLSDPAQNDVQKEFGFFEVPIRYRKMGARFDFQWNIFCDFILEIQAGVADIRQTASFVDLTCSATGLSCPVRGCTDPTAGCPTATESCVDNNCCIDIFDCGCKRLTIDKIMKQFECVITPTLNQDVHNFHKVAPEDTRIFLTWRHLFDINRMRPTWAEFLFLPWFTAQVSVPTGDCVPANKLFALPAGNNGHLGYGFNTGFAFDFVETCEIAFEASMTKWKPRVYHCYPVPTNCLQSGIYPRLATVKVHPGTNWTVAGTLSAYHFLDRLSVWVQYVFVSHGHDCYTDFVTEGFPVTNIEVKQLIDNSKWEAQMVNVGFNYDLSPNIGLGLFWQAPVKRRNAYRSTTLLGSLVISF